ncbi:MAG: ATP phosphoribosyltransferase [Clostridia bacterium]|nr:ATP phosphoribosyltransferase [Clostridia bacterium]
MFDKNILSKLELSIYKLRELFLSKGYRKFKMNKFEEYDLYSKNKEFLVSDGVIVFNDTNGKLLALKPDVTLSIIKNTKDDVDAVEKVFYDENVYRISPTSHTYKEIMQTGLECIGRITFDRIVEVSELALRTLGELSSDFILQLANIDLAKGILSDYGISQELIDRAIVAITQKNLEGISDVFDEGQCSAIKVLVSSHNSIRENLQAIEKIIISEDTKEIFGGFKKVVDNLINLGFEDRIAIDFSIIDFDSYYSGLVFKGFVRGISTKVLSGGQYDNLLKKMNRRSSAIGFAVYLDEIERLDEKSEETDDYIKIALPKGRLGEKVYQMFENAGFDCPAIKENNRKLIFENDKKKLKFFWVKPSDVSIYVERGSADIGIAGKDIIEEYKPDVFELLDLNVGKCKMAVASKKDFVDDKSKTLRVATKFSNIASDYYAKKCRDIDIIHLNGSIEIAPILNLADVIVDIVETGRTLLENDLVPFETIMPISARLIVNKTSYGFKNKQINEIKNGLSNEATKND